MKRLFITTLFLAAVIVAGVVLAPSGAAGSAHSTLTVPGLVLSTMRAMLPQGGSPEIQNEAAADWQVSEYDVRSDPDEGPIFIPLALGS
ncbi:MAG: hypothetical protein MUC92_05745 [Fimbriimonadaceae bacterium]|jgi:hypothetical protein|nr:hypothetical protein [Fimbriimonadaceae bacterium]